MASVTCVYRQKSSSPCSFVSEEWAAKIIDFFGYLPFWKHFCHCSYTINREAMGDFGEQWCLKTFMHLGKFRHLKFWAIFSMPQVFIRFNLFHWQEI